MASLASTWGSDETIRATPALLCRRSPAKPSPTGPSLPLHQPWEPMPERHGTAGLMPFQTQRGAPSFTTVSCIVVNSDMTRSHPFKGRVSPAGGKRSSLYQVTVTEQMAKGQKRGTDVPRSLHRGQGGRGWFQDGRGHPRPGHPSKLPWKGVSESRVHTGWWDRLPWGPGPGGPGSQAEQRDSVHGL